MSDNIRDVHYMSPVEFQRRLIQATNQALNTNSNIADINSIAQFVSSALNNRRTGYTVMAWPSDRQAEVHVEHCSDLIFMATCMNINGDALELKDFFILVMHYLNIAVLFEHQGRARSIRYVCVRYVCVIV